MGFFAPSAGYGDAREHVWASGFGSWTRQKDTQVMGCRCSAGGVILGYDQELASVPGLTLGLTGAFSKGTLKNSGRLAKTGIGTFSPGVCGLYEFGNGLYLDPSLGSGWAKNQFHISFLNARKTGDFDSDNFQAALNLGYAVQLTDSTRLIPSSGIQYIHIKQDGWRKKIALIL
jgi:outer membrane autotransporter protein